MTNDEIRLKIAELKGFNRRQGLMDLASNRNQEYWITPNGNKTSVLPDWPGNISDAWELVEVMYNYNIKKIGGVVTAVLYPDTHILRGQVGKAYTAPVAICLAYIGVKESQK